MEVEYNSFFAIDLGKPTGVWNVRLIVQQQGMWRYRITLNYEDVPSLDPSHGES